MRRRHLPPFEVEITALGERGVSLGLAPDGREVQVRPAAPGARIAVIPSGRKKGRWIGRRQAMIRPPADSAQPPCEVFGLCGGCTLQELGLASQRAAKQDLARALVQPGPEVKLHEVRGLPGGYGYRNKIELTFGPRRYLSEAAHQRGEPIEGRFMGFHAPGRFDRVVDLARCWIAGDALNELITIARAQILEGSELPCWDPRSHEGFWRNLLLREGQRTGERMAVLYTTSAGDLQHVRPVAEALAAAGVESVQWAVNDGVAGVARGEVRQIWGRPTIDEKIGPVRVQVSPHSFLQTSTPGAELLYDTIGELLPEADTLLDLYCGVGSIGLYLADRVQQIRGVEEVPEAVIDARRNARQNGVEASFEQARVEDALHAIQGGDGTAIVVDPPRAGLHPKVARALAATRAAGLIYVACNPASLGRDLKVLSEGWRLTELVPVDLFPQTHHLEIVARFEPRAAG